MQKSTGSVISTLLFIGAVIWSIPLVWYYKNKKDNQTK